MPPRLLPGKEAILIIHQLQSNRSEYKYVLHEAQATTVRDFVRSYLVPDDNAKPELASGYSIYSVYLDNAERDLYNGTARGLKNRFKLRVRYYETLTADQPVFFEIKRRAHDRVLKERAIVRRAAWPRLLDGLWPDPSDLVKPDDASAYGSLVHFCGLARACNAAGAVIVGYHREAYVAPDNNEVRVTFDRNLIGRPFEGALHTAEQPGWVHPPMGGVVLELKFTGRFPFWMHDLVQLFDLQRVSFPKYVICADEIARERAFSKPVVADVYPAVASSPLVVAE